MSDQYDNLDAASQPLAVAVRDYYRAKNAILATKVQVLTLMVSQLTLVTSRAQFKMPDGRIIEGYTREVSEMLWSELPSAESDIEQMLRQT